MAELFLQFLFLPLSLVLSKNLYLNLNELESVMRSSASSLWYSYKLAVVP